jgi:[acyl-carrier-protein] S-malonyltransferase
MAAMGDLGVTGMLVVEWLVEDGDPVSPGQPLLRLHPTVESADATEVTR